MHNYYENIVLRADIVLLVLCAILSVVIIIYAALTRWLETKRREKLMALISRMQETVLTEKKPVIEGCVGIVRRTDPFEFLDIARHKDHILPKEFSEQFMKCIAVSGRIDKAEKVAERSWNKWSRIEAMITIGYLKTPHSLKILTRLTHDKDDDIVYFSALALGYMKTQEAAMVLLGLIRDCTISGYRIASILEGFPPQELENEISRCLDDNDESLLFWAIKLASKFKLHKCINKIKHLSNDKSPLIKAAAIECMKELS